MPFKSGRFWSGSRANFGALIALALLGPGTAYATVTAQLVQGGNLVNPMGATNTTFFFAGAVAASRGAPVTLSGCLPAGTGITGGGAPLGTSPGCATFFYPGFNALDLGASAGAGGDPSGTNVITFQVSSSTLTASTSTPGTSSSYEIVATAYPAAGQTAREYVPIATYGGQPCSNGCFTLGNVINYTNGGQAFYAAPFTPGSTVNIGLYPADICWSSITQNPNAGNTAALAIAAGCSPVPNTYGGYSVTPIVDGAAAAAAGTTNQIQIEFDIYSIPTNPAGPNVALSGTPADTGTAYILNFQGDTPTMIPSSDCPNVTTSYTPGDGQVFFKSGYFGIEIATPAGTPMPLDVSHAPAMNLVVASKKGQNPVPDIGADPANALATFQANEDLQATPLVPLSNILTLNGFADVTSPAQTDPNSYQLQIMVQDATGMVAVPIDQVSGTPGCSLIDVQASKIQGFLSGSQCFIATGAFRSGTAAPVMLLRAFRDQVLLHTGAGKAFVHWYYGWSPPAAVWLIDHPIFRFPILLALVPLEAIAWLALHPALLSLVLLGAMAVLAMGISIRRLRG